MALKRILFYIFLLFSMTSYFEVVQQMQIKQDNSGTLKLIVNLSQSKNRLQKILSQDQINGISISSQSTIENHLTKIERQITQHQDLTLKHLQKDFENYIFTLEVDFKHPQALNTVFTDLQALFSKKSNNEFAVKLEAPKNGFSQEINPVWLKKLNSQLHEYQLSELKNAQITTITKFDKAISSCSVTEGRISKSGNSVLIKQSLDNFLNTYTQQKLNIQLHD